MNWFRRKATKSSVTVEFNGRTYILTKGDTLYIQHTVRIEGEASGTLTPIPLPVKVVSID